ncbi:MAG: CotH kinase family protein [Oscillospiraceae bacterium]|nr:CotH kinase family protein [Oscillospiraceae bacterium]
MHKRNHPILYVLAVLMLTVIAFAAFLERKDPLRARADGPAAEASPAPTPKAEPVPSLMGKLRITELMEKNRSVIRDEDGDYSDWIELANVSDEAIDLEGCRIADRVGRYGWTFPAVELRPGERLLLFASRKNRFDDEMHMDFALSEYDCVYLYDAANTAVDCAACGGCAADVSMALDADGNWAESLYPTPGYPNTPDGYEAWQQTLIPAGPLVISEAAVRNLGLTVAGNSRECDWVEIKNISDEAVRLSDYYLSDKEGEPFFWRMPDTELRSGAVVLFVCEEPGSDFYGNTPCTGFSLNSAHEQLYIRNRAGELVDAASLRDIPAGGSYGRMDGQDGFFYFAKPTPGKENAGGLRRVSAKPRNLTPDGVFEGVEKIMLELEGEGVLRYTINGSAPTADSTRYTGPIEIDKTCVVSVKSFEKGALPSRTLSLSFIVNEGHTLPVASFVAENFKEFHGIYSVGSKLYELPGTLALYREDGESFNINCGVTLNGETSLVLPKKNLAVHISGGYGDEVLNCDLYGGGATSFTALLLRAGQDQYQGVIRNELAQRMAEKADTAAINQRSFYCVLYLNGEYEGIYTLKERPNASLYANVAGVEKDSVECFEAPAPYGTAFYRETVDFINDHDMTLEENYAQFCKVVNIDSLIDWLILEGFCANTDVTSGNLRYARSDQADGKWHLLFYDLDAAFRSFDSIQSHLLNDYSAGRIQVAAISVPLMKNESFRTQFLTRAAALLQGPLSNESVLEEIDRMADELRPEIPRDYEKVGSNAASWERSIRDLKSMIEDRDWCQANIDNLSRIFGLSAGERAAYFGGIDRNPPKPKE